MKFIHALILVLLVIARPNPLKCKTPIQGTEVSFQIFYDELSPYGEWVDYPDYGYVWMPAVAPGFIPYSSGGHWVFTDYGWTWVSDFNWGWAPFHYGRWGYDEVYGWFWVPGVVWGPAWVAWRKAPGYYGWIPLAPGVDMNVYFNNDYYGRRDNWIFVNDHYFGKRDAHRHYVPRTDNDRIIRSSTVINNTHVDERRRTTYVTGPDRDEVQKVTDTKIAPVAVKEEVKPGQTLNGNELSIYRPAVTPDSRTKAAPAKVTNLQELRTRREQVQPAEQNKPAEKAAPGQGEQQRRNTNPSAPPRTTEQAPADHKTQPAQPEPQNKSTAPREKNADKRAEPGSSTGSNQPQRAPSAQPNQQAPEHNTPPPAQNHPPVQPGAGDRKPQQQIPVNPPAPQQAPSRRSAPQQNRNPVPAPSPKAPERRR